MSAHSTSTSQGTVSAISQMRRHCAMDDLNAPVPELLELSVEIHQLELRLGTDQERESDMPERASM